MLAAEGVELNRSTLAHWVGFAAFELAPLDPAAVDVEVIRRGLATLAKRWSRPP